MFVLDRSGSMKGLEGDTADGMEHASRRYSAQRVEEMIQRKKEKYDRAVNYHCDSEGTRLNYEVVGQAVAAVRCSAPLDEHWKDAIKENFRKQQKQR